MANSNTISIQLIVKDDGSVAIKQFGDNAQSSFEKAKSSGSGLGTSLAATWAQITTGVGAAIYIFEKVKSTIEAPIEAFMAAESASLKLGMAMKNQGDYSREGLAGLQEYAAQLQQTTAYEDDQLTAVMGNLKSYGMLNDEVKNATRVAMDFASAKANEGMSITSASELIGKAYAGETSMLSRYGIVIDDNIPKNEKFAAVMQQLQARFGGSAQAELSTYAGQWKQIKNEWSDVQEVIGFGLLKGIEALLVAGGLLTVTFLTAGNAILGILRMLVSPIMVLLDGLALLAKAAGMPGVAEGLGTVTSAIGNAQENIVAAREGVLGWTSKNYDLLASTDNVTKGLDGMNIQGQRTKQTAEDAAKAIAEQTKTLLELSAIMGKIGDDQLKFASADFSDSLKKENASLGEMTASLGTYLAALQKVYDARIEGEGAVQAAMAAAGAKPVDQMKAQLETLKTEKAYITDRLGAWQQYYNTLIAYHGKATDLMKQKTEELKKLEDDAAAARKSGAEAMLALQLKLMEAQGKAANDEEIYRLKDKAAEDQWALAMSQSGEARIKSIQEYIQMVGQLTGEVVRYGVVTSVTDAGIVTQNQTVMTSQDAIKLAMDRTQFAQAAVTAETQKMIGAKAGEIAAIKEADQANDVAMADAKTKIGDYQQQVITLGSIIEKMDRNIAIGITDKASGPIAQIRALLDGIQDKVINVTINQQTVTSGGGGAQAPGSSAPGESANQQTVTSGGGGAQASGSSAPGESAYPEYPTITGAYPEANLAEGGLGGGGAQASGSSAPGESAYPEYPTITGAYPEANLAEGGLGGGNYALPGDGGYMPLGQGGYALPDWGSEPWFGSYAAGTKYVPKTGPYLLHQGEEVRTQAEARQSSGQPVTVNMPITIQGANKPPEQIIREIIQPLRAELRRQDSWAA